ncbi:MAG: Fpg/Nei family DNA glycosylase [Bacteroidales bacterium]
MPELPDVETFKRYADKNLSGHKLNGVEINDQKVLISSSDKMKKELKGNKINSFSRKGKYLYASVSKSDLFLLMHFGMTGYLKLYREEKNKPDNSPVIFELGNHSFLAFVNQRKFGEIGLIEDPGEYFKRKKLGPDALKIEKDEFIKLFEKKKGAIKPRLMDQSNICGLGNVYVDEILFQAEIHPEQDCNKLNEKNWEHIYSVMKRVLEITIKHQADPKEFPSHYLTYNRKEGRECENGNKIKKIEVGGRATYFCPGRQRKLG